MQPDLNQRVAAVLHELRGLDDDAAAHFLRELRRSDPDVALKLDVLLWAQGSEYRERLADFASSTPADREEAPPTRTDDYQPHASEEPPTVSVDARATASFSPPDPTSPHRMAQSNRTLGRYQLLRMVGCGAFGEVWQAYDPLLQKHVAVKAPLPREFGTATASLHEARKAASLRHPAIVRVFDVVEGGNGWYIVSEFIEGGSLRDRVTAGRLPFDQTARIVAAVAGALHAAHQSDLIHRDVKPANILLDRAGNAYLTDFGLALGEDDQHAERNKVSGTFAYMPPEQISGDTHLMDGRADIYALGAVLYELLTARPMFRAESIEEYRELILRREPRPPRSVDDTIPAELERICLKCLAKEIRDRYRTAQDLASDLEAWLAGATRSAAPAQPPADPASGRWWRRAVGAAVLLCLLVAAVAVLNSIDGRRTVPTAAEPVKPTAPGPGPIPEPVRQVPTVKELVWPSGKTDSRWAVKTNPDRLTVLSESISLLQLGTATADAWELFATLRRPTGRGQVGLFFGHHENPRTGTATYELVRLVGSGEQLYLHRRVETYRLDAPLAGSKGDTNASVPVKGAESYTLRLVVRNNRLAEVHLNGQPVPGLVNVPQWEPASGPFGAHARTSDGVFSTLLFNDKPIPLLTEASTQHPEKP